MHVGPDPNSQGGMASVIAELLALDSAVFVAANTASWRPQGKLASLRLAMRAARSLWVTRSNFDILHAHVSERGSYLREGAVAVLARALGKPSVITLHGANSYDESPPWRIISRTVIRGADAVIALGPNMAAQVEEATGVAPSIVPNPVSVPALGDLADNAISNRVVFAGEVGERKGFDLLAAAWPTVKMNVPDAELRVCGPIAPGFNLVSLEGSTYLGVLDRSETISEISSAQVLCLPSRNEVLPMAILEALANGLSIVCSDAGESGLFEGAPGSTVLTNPISADGLARALIDSLATSTPGINRAQANGWARTHVSHQVVESHLASVYTRIARRGAET